MKKLLLASLMALPASSYADFIGIHGQIGVWNASFNGETAGLEDKLKRDASNLSIPSFKERGFEEDNQNVAWIAFEHPLPFLPNVRLAYLDASSSGNSPEPIDLASFTIVTTVDGIDNGPVTATLDDESRLQTTMDLTSLDGTLYWEVLDNWVNLDLGLTIRKLDGSFNEVGIGDTFLPLPPEQCNQLNWPVNPGLGGGVTPVDGCLRPGSTLAQSTPIDIVLPLLYAKFQLDIPFSGFFASATLQGISFDKNSMFDTDIEVGYMFDLTVMELGASVGYRRASLKADDLEGLYTDASLDGAQFNLKLHF